MVFKSLRKDMESIRKVAVLVFWDWAVAGCQHWVFSGGDLYAESAQTNVIIPQLLLIRIINVRR